MLVTRTDPFKIRLKDESDVYVVEEIRGHKGMLSRTSTLQFEVKWVGYEATTMEPWCNIRDNILLHEYLSKIGKANHIPKKFKCI